MYQLRAQMRGVDARDSLYILFLGVNLVSHVKSHTALLARLIVTQLRTSADRSKQMEMK